MDNIQLKKNHLVKINSYNPNFTTVTGKNLNYIYQYLMNMGIKEEDVPCFTERPRDTDEDNPYLLDNMKEAVQTAIDKINFGAKVMVIVDSDTDGYTSSAILINYLRRRFPNLDIMYKLHPGKEHGIVLKDIPEDRDLIFVPDAGSNNYAEQKALTDIGKTVIILDHHEINTIEQREFGPTGAIIVNNQSSAHFPNKNLSGAGVVYMFIKAIDDTYYHNSQIYEDYMDLAAVGIIADAMDMTSLGNNFISYYGLNHIRNQFIKEVAIRQAHGIKDPNHLTKIDVAFYIAPLINGTIRSGDMEDKVAVFDAMSHENSIETIDTVWRGNTRHETIYQYAARLGANAKSRQDAGKKKAFEWLSGMIKEKGYDNDNLIIANLEGKDADKVDQNVTGLIAMELVKYFNKPVIVARKTKYDNKEMFGGSLRNGNFFGLTDLRQFLINSGLVYYCEGHANAAGVFIEPDKIDALRDYSNINLDKSAFKQLYEVDYIFNNKAEVDKEMLFQFASYSELWGKGIEQPKFAFEGEIDYTDVYIMGADKSSIKIKFGDVSLVMFKKPELAKQLSSGQKTYHFKAVGRPQLNEWNGMVSVQIMVDDFELVDESEFVSKPNNLLDLI